MHDILRSGRMYPQSRKKENTVEEKKNMCKIWIYVTASYLVEGIL